MYPFKIPLGIIERIMNDCYAGDGTVHPSIHLLKLIELCELFKLSGMTRDEVMRKLFALSLKEKALEWYRLLDNSHLLDWEELKSLFYSSSILFMKSMRIGIIFIIFILMTERALLKLGGD